MLKKICDLQEKLSILSDNKTFLKNLKKTEEILIRSIKSNNKILICGNGGSATQASHMMGEIVGRFKFDRPAMGAISLFDLASTTAIGNDYGYNKVFSRFVDGLGKEGDILLSLSTSGNSLNCIEAIESAKQKGVKTISLLGADGGKMLKLSDISILIPFTDTPLIQEIHLMIIHHLCDKLEQRIFKSNK